MSLAFRLLAEASPSAFSISSITTLPAFGIREAIWLTIIIELETSTLRYRFHSRSQIGVKVLEIYL